MFSIEKILGNPKDWKLTENEILDFIEGIKTPSQLTGLFKRIIENDIKTFSNKWDDKDWNTTSTESPGTWSGSANYKYVPAKKDSVDDFVEFLSDMSTEDRETFEKNLKKSPKDNEVWNMLHPLDKKQIFKESSDEFYDFLEKLTDDDYKYYIERILNGKRLLSFNSMQKVRADKMEQAFDELLKIINDDVVRVTIDEDKTLIISSTNLDRLESLREKLQSFGGVFGECDYNYKTKNMVTVHYYIFKRL